MLTLGAKHTQVCWRNAVFQNCKLQLAILQFLSTPFRLTGSPKPASGETELPCGCSRYALARTKRQSGTHRKITLGNIATERTFPPMWFLSLPATRRIAARGARDWPVRSTDISCP